MKNDERRTIRILCIFGLIPVIWLALLIAPAVSGGLPKILQHFPKAMENPFHIELCQDSKKTVLIFMLIYGLGIGVALSSRRHYRRGEEHGSAKWGSASAINRKYQAKDPEANKVFTKHVRMGLDGKKHRRNLNTVVVGGSGSGKSRFYALINLLQACTSYFVLDCKGELLRMTGTFLKMRGYEIKVLDLLSMDRSHCFNPFAYLHTDNDVQKLVTNLFKATTPKGSQSQDPFWDTTASMLLSAIIFYLLYEAPEEEQNFPMVMEMLRAGEVREDDDTYQSPLDELFERLEIHDLSEDLKQPGFVTITDAMLNRVNFNWAQGTKTHVIVDEFHIAYENEYSGNFFTSAWRQFRKRNASPVAITQNVDYLLDAPQARSMLSNSEFIVMLNQAEKDQERLSQLLNISPEQMRYVNGSEAGSGLLRYGNALVPFINKFPMDTELYRLITTRPGEGVFAKGQVDFDA